MLTFVVQPFWLSWLWSYDGGQVHRRIYHSFDKFINTAEWIGRRDNTLSSTVGVSTILFYCAVSYGVLFSVTGVTCGKADISFWPINCVYISWYSIENIGVGKKLGGLATIERIQRWGGGNLLILKGFWNIYLNIVVVKFLANQGIIWKWKRL